MSVQAIYLHFRLFSLSALLCLFLVLLLLRCGGSPPSPEQGGQTPATDSANPPEAKKENVPPRLTAEQQFLNAVNRKFSQSSGATAKNVRYSDGMLVIETSDTAGSDIDTIAIDVAVALNRSPLFNFSSVQLEKGNEHLRFTRNDFEMYRTGQIGDVEFIRRARHNKLK
jgi:hypothetical protein